ncbi:uncharacterized protein KY384_007467 [Bacidia gigantensis]|uniref:uncharacterized protein n=1 Tax=Bacidia gigantensis TaxID=2732470 RepID=UPI001D058569|nr:uncharacterized protein KY384_007467 [Bacidia gigantensis]KAG8528549.1 hypothetical protein KY384_007467 [Bacidia gigantensis]
MFAFTTLFFRALLVYAELATAIFQNLFVVPSSSTETSRSTVRRRKGKSAPVRKRISRENSAASGSSNGGSSTPRAAEAIGLGAYGGGEPTRDFEGVGGWRMPGPDEDDVLWTQMNSRLELPAAGDDRYRHHRRSTTSSGLTENPWQWKSPSESPAVKIDNEFGYGEHWEDHTEA